MLSAPRVALIGCFLGMLGASVTNAQSTPDDPSAPASSTAPPAAPRPRMGLEVPLTPPQSQPAVKPSAKGGAKSPGKAAAKSAATLPAKSSPYQNTRGTEKAKHYYSEVWGVDKLRANYTSSGNLIKFSYRVVQPKLAKTLGDHENTPELIGIRSNAVLHIPTMEKIGQLRQMSAAEANKDYWMVFSNKGNLVKPGDEVSVIIGKFRADGLIVE
jgi:hypothetical protein